MSIKSRIGNRISECRKKLGMTIKALAEKTGSLSAARISNWEQGTRSPGPMEAKTLAHVLEVAPSYLLCLTDNPKGDLYRSSDTLLTQAPLIKLNQVPLKPSKQALSKTTTTEESATNVSIELNTQAIAGPNTFATTIEDTSMHPDFSPGDIILADPDLKPKPGQFVIAHIKATHENLVRKYRETSGQSASRQQFELVATNSDWANMAIQDKKEGIIIATLIEHRRALI